MPPKKTGNNFPAILKKSRVAKGYTQKEISTLLGYTSAQFVSNWERGMSNPPMETIVLLEKEYKASLLEVFIEEELRNFEAQMREKYAEAKAKVKR